MTLFMNTLALINFDLIKRATESGPDIKPVGTLVIFRVSRLLPSCHT